MSSTIPPSSDTPFEIYLQELSIKMIDYRRLEREYRAFKRLDKESVTPDLKTLAEFIVSCYNDKNRLSDGSTPIQPLEIPSEKWQQIPTNQFSILPFYSFTPLNNPITRMFVMLGSPNNQSQETSYLFFLFRVHKTVNEIFALTSGNRGYLPVQPFADFTFPRKIALRILNPSSISKETSKRIIGPVFSSTEMLRSNVMFDPNSLQKIYTEFKASLKKNSSIHEICYFQNALGKTPQKGAEVEIKEGLIRFHKQLPLKAYPLILNHLAKIARGEQTYLTSENKVNIIEEDSKEDFAFLDYFTPVSSQRHLALQNRLSKELASALNNDIKLEWTLAHPHASDYFKAHDFRLRYVNKIGNPITIEWKDERKTFHEIMTLLKTIPNLKLEDSILACKLYKVYIDFKLGSDWKQASLFDCLIGQVHVNLENEWRTFFKLNSKWYEISTNLLSRVNSEFRKLLIDCLINEQDEGFLYRPWQSVPQNLTYQSISKFLEIDKELIITLLSSQVKFLDSKGTILHNTLEGDILCDPVISYFKKNIESLLSKTTITLQDLVKTLNNESFAQSVLTQLKKQRPIAETKKIIEKNKEKTVVIIKNPFPPKNHALFKHKKKLKKWSLKEDYTMHEGPYNEGYLFVNKEDKTPYKIEENGWLVGDRIVVEGIELFDVAHYTKEKIYLYHVKKSFDSAREALSQVMNSARALSICGNRKNEFLLKFFNEAIKKPEKGTPNFNYFDAVRTQLLSWGDNSLTKFLELFQKRKIVFVYALADDRVNDHLISLDRLKKDSFTEEDFTQEKTKDAAKKIFTFLKDKNFLTSEGKKGIRFSELYDVKALKFEDDLSPYTTIVWKILAGDIGHFQSLIGRMDLLHTRAQVEGLGFEFKFCQIRRPGSHQSSTIEEIKPINWCGLNEELSTQMKQQTQEELLFYRNPDWFQGAECWIKQKTKADGSCAFHALLGDSVEGVFQGDVDNMRKTSTEKLKSYLNKNGDGFTDKVLQDRYEANIKSMISERENSYSGSSNASSQLSKSADMLFKNLDAFDTYLKDNIHQTQMDLAKKIFTGATEQSHLTKALHHGSQVKTKLFFNQLKNNTSLLQSTVETSIPELEELTKQPTYKRILNHVEKIKSNKKIKEDLQGHLFLHDKELMENFLNCIQNRDYWLSDDELQMIAHVHALRVEIIRPDGEDYGCNNKHSLKARATDTRNMIVIQATNTHFSRCIKHNTTT